MFKPYPAVAAILDFQLTKKTHTFHEGLSMAYSSQVLRSELSLNIFFP